METIPEIKSERIYLIFSITTTKVGKMIRRVTKYPYNHVSVSLDESLEQVYSFARFYRDTPLYGGFVRETRLRYNDHNGIATIKVCAVPVTSEQYKKAVNFIANVSANSECYIYNAISAAFAPVHKRIRIERAFTCAEFAIELLNFCHIEGAPDPRRYCSIEKLIEIYGEYDIYTGPFPDYDPPSDDYYNRKNAILRRVKTTVFSNARLIGRLCRRIIS